MVVSRGRSPALTPAALVCAVGESHFGCGKWSADAASNPFLNYEQNVSSGTTNYSQSSKTTCIGECHLQPFGHLRILCHCRARARAFVVGRAFVCGGEGARLLASRSAWGRLPLGGPTCAARTRANVLSGAFACSAAKNDISCGNQASAAPKGYTWNDTLPYGTTPSAATYAYGGKRIACKGSSVDQPCTGVGSAVLTCGLGKAPLKGGWRAINAAPTSAPTASPTAAPTAAAGR